MEHLYISRLGDKQIIKEYRERLKKLSDSEMIEAGESAKKTGIVGVHAQALYLIALWYEMKDRFIDSPIVVEGDGYIIGLKDD